MKILLLSRWFFPAKNPRAFRTTELVREFTKRGYEVDFFCPEDAVIPDGVLIDLLHIYRIPLSVSHVQDGGGASPGRCSPIKYMKQIVRYLLGASPRDLLYAVSAYREMKRKGRIKKYDVVLAVSYPFYLLVAAVCYMLYNQNVSCRVADCGDPLFYNPGINKAFYLKYVEKMVLCAFDWITIPVEDAISGYRHCGIEERLRVVPQGVQLLYISDRTYLPHSVPTFCYAGIFYEKIRNPKYFFDFLCACKDPFRFVVYALDDPFTQTTLMKYKNCLGDKLVLKEPVEREHLIHEMAKMDFVLNFDNENSNQRPSKLIDYAMSRRPILSFNRQTFRPDVFQAFLKGDYSEQYHVDLEQYDIRRVVDKFEALFHEKTKE